VERKSGPARSPSGLGRRGKVHAGPVSGNIWPPWIGPWARGEGALSMRPMNIAALAMPPAEPKETSLTRPGRRPGTNKGQMKVGFRLPATTI